MNYNKPDNPNLIEYLRSTARLNASSIDYGEFLHDFNKKTGFADDWSLMTFVIDAATQSYPFINKAAAEVSGYRIEALREGSEEGLPLGN